ncbi:MAG TPA: YkgJ family cysteine cluster protein [Flavihumibacter sp.]|nr:YkgJ family cysteine cluster protein [Flavihumibacter sp.]HQD09588.1 YkgJ family cysteine cluster protein [Flavihumibacter sp.]
MNRSEPLLTDLDSIARIAEDERQENEDFTRWLKEAGESVDATVMRLQADIAPQISCTDCGNCCRSLIIHVEPTDIPPLAQRLDLSVDDFTARYLEKGIGNDAVISQVPCHFLAGNWCTVYEDRFSACRSFPHLDVPGFSKRAFALMQQVGRCPIVFNVIKVLKSETGFR